MSNQGVRLLIHQCSGCGVSLFHVTCVVAVRVSNQPITKLCVLAVSQTQTYRTFQIPRHSFQVHHRLWTWFEHTACQSHDRVGHVRPYVCAYVQEGSRRKLEIFDVLWCRHLPVDHFRRYLSRCFGRVMFIIMNVSRMLLAYAACIRRVVLVVALTLRLIPMPTKELGIAGIYTFEFLLEQIKDFPNLIFVHT